MTDAMTLGPDILEGRFVRLEPVTPDLVADVRAALNCDPDTWAIMGASAYGERFDGWWLDAQAEAAARSRITYAVRRLSDGAVVGSTSLMNIRWPHRGVEIGWTFYRPDARGGPVNPECKRLLMAHAFDGGAIRVELMVDLRNGRSQAAVAKLGAVREGVMRRHKITWTGHLRDTVVFSVIDTEWPAVRTALDERLSRF